MLKENPVLLLLQQFVLLKPYPAADQAVLERSLRLIEILEFDLGFAMLFLLHMLLLLYPQESPFLAQF